MYRFRLATAAELPADLYSQVYRVTECTLRPTKNVHILFVFEYLNDNSASLKNIFGAYVYWTLLTISAILLV